MVPGSEPPGFLILRDRTLGYHLLACDPGDGSRLYTLATGQLRQAKCFSLALRIVATLVKAVLDITKLGLPGAGWFVYILAVMRTARQIRVLAPDIVQLEGVS